MLELLSQIPEALLESVEHANHDGEKLTDHYRTLNVLRHSIDYVGQARIVLDGMDELSENSQKIVCAVLQDLLQKTDAVIKLFVTGREDPVSMIQAKENIFSVQILPSRISTDIAQYVLDTTSSLLNKGDLVLQDPSLQDLIVQKLVEGAHGI